MPLEDQDQVDSLVNALVEQAMRRPGGTALPLPRPAEGNPSIERAMNTMDKTYKDTRNIIAKPDWSPDMFTNTLGFTNDDSSININAIHAALSAQPDIDHTVAHELEHTRQFKRDPFPNDSHDVGDWVRRHELNKPYAERKPEEDARYAAHLFQYNRKPTNMDNITPGVPGRVYDQIQQSPLVKELIRILNGANAK